MSKSMRNMIYRKIKMELDKAKSVDLTNVQNVY